MVRGKPQTYRVSSLPPPCDREGAVGVATSFIEHRGEWDDRPCRCSVPRSVGPKRLDDQLRLQAVLNGGDGGPPPNSEKRLRALLDISPLELLFLHDVRIHGGPVHLEAHRGPEDAARSVGRIRGQGPHRTRIQSSSSPGT
eukprot:1129381-Pyramimonas_sp.AAC.1